MKKKPIPHALPILVAIAAGLALLLLILRLPLITESTGYRFLNGMLRSWISASNEDRLQRANTRPYALTNGQSVAEALVPEDAVNLLLVGPDVSGANWDTLMIASLEENTSTVRLVNIPRDLRVEYSDEVLDALQNASPKTYASVPARKINAAHLIGKRIDYRAENRRFDSAELDFTADLIQEIFGIRIDDCLITSPSGFRDLVDAFGGVDIEVPYRMKYVDPLQQLSIDLQPGLRHLDGAAAEGFVRFRQGTDDNGKKVSIGDVARKENQTAFLRAFIAQHATPSNLGRILKLSGELGKYYDGSLTSPDRLSAYAGMGLSMIGNLEQIQVPLHTEDFKQDGIYFLRLVPAPVQTSK